MPDPIDPEALAAALDSAIDNAIYWRDYCARDGENEAWQADVATLEAAMPVLLAAPDMLAALRELDANCENRQDEPFVAYVRSTVRAVIAKAAAAPEPAEPPKL